MQESHEIIKKEIGKNRRKLKEMYGEQIEKERKEVLKDISKSDIKNGLWFQKLILRVFKTHSKNVSAEYFQKKYGAASKDIVAKKVIKSYLNYNAAIGVVVGGAGGLGEIKIAISSIFPEVALVTYNQLKMIYDLSVIYDAPVNMDDPEEVFWVLLTAYGIRISEILKTGTKVIIDKGGKLIIEKAGKRVVLRKLQQVILKALGKKVTQNSIKKVIAKGPPIIGSIFGAITCGTIDYFSTKEVADRTLYLYRTKKLIIEYFLAHDRIYENVKMNWILHWLFKKKEEERYICYSQILAKGCWIMVNSEKSINQNKMALVDYIYSTKPLEEEFISSMKKRVKIPVEEFLNDFNHIRCRNKKKELKIKKTIFYAMELIAVSDKKISKEEISILGKVAPSLNIDQDQLRKEIEDLKNDIFKF